MLALMVIKSSRVEFSMASERRVWSKSGQRRLLRPLCTTGCFTGPVRQRALCTEKCARGHRPSDALG
jgi:hypothetical protein